MVRKEIEKIRPDVIVCDFYTRVGVEIADELGIPSVINIPGMLEMCNNFGLSGIIDMKNAKSCCG